MKITRIHRLVPNSGFFAVGLSGLIIAFAGAHGADAQVPVYVSSIDREFSYADNHVEVNISNEHGDLYAGAQNVKLDVNSPNPANLPVSFDAYCVDIFSEIRDVSQTVTASPLDNTFSFGVAAGNSGINVGGAIAWLYNNYVGVDVDQTETSARESTALQLSIWEVEYNWTGTGLGGIDPTLMTGNFNYAGSLDGTNPLVYDTANTNAIRTDAASMLAAWDGQVDTATLLSPSSVSSQSLVGPRTSFAAAPEPSALSMAILPILGLAASRAVRRRKG